MEVGLASSVISTSGDTLHSEAMVSSTWPTASGGIKEGVPPPKKMEVTVRPGVRAANHVSSVPRAFAKERASTPSWRTWLLKSQ